MNRFDRNDPVSRRLSRLSLTQLQMTARILGVDDLGVNRKSLVRALSARMHASFEASELRANMKNSGLAT